MYCVMEGAAAGEFGFLQLHPKGSRKEAGVGGSLRPTVWDELTSPIPLPPQAEQQ